MRPVRSIRLRMILLSTCSLLLLLTANSTILQTAHASPNLGEYRLVFSDEFNGSELDSEKWNTGLLWGPYLPINNEQQLYVDSLGMHQDFDYSPFQFTGSSLKIVATEVSPELQPPPMPDENDPVWDRYGEYRYNGPSASGPGYQPEDVKYLSGIITSYDSFRFTHGYVEARMKLPKGQGLWPAFWTNTSFYVEDVPEIDVMEFLGHQTDRVYHTYHYFEPANNWRKISTPSYTTIQDDFTAGWHTFGMEWGPDEIIWYVDGKETRRIDSNEYEISNQAMYLLANLAVGGTWPGNPDPDTEFPAELEIDYIRAYRRDIPNLITPAQLSDSFQLVFEDDFDGNSLNDKKWNTSFLWGPYLPINSEEQIYPDILGEHKDYQYNPFSIDDGILNITARSVDESELPEAQDPTSQQFVNNPTWRSSGGYRDRNSENYYVPGYVSGILTSYNSFKFVNGYAEIRAKMPAGSGLWPAFWLLNGYYVYQQPEIDIIEFRGENPDEIVHSYHYYSSQGLQSESSSFTGDDFTAGFHTFGVHWQPDRIDWYVDGEITHTTSAETISSQLMYLILNLAVGGGFVSEVDQQALPASLQVDYVRVWQLDLPAQLPFEPPVNIPPVAVDDVGEVVRNGSSKLSILSNDSDDNQELAVNSVQIVADGTQGNAVANPDGTVTYTHTGSDDANVDRFTYQVSDRQGAVSNPAEVSVSITEGVDETAPEATITSPLAGAELQPSSVSLSGSVTEAGGSGLDRVFVSVQNAAGQWLDFDSGEFSTVAQSFDAQLSNLEAEAADWTARTPVLTSDSYTAHVTAVDNAGNTSDVARRNFVVSNSPETKGELYQEAESGVLSGAMSIVSDTSASSGAYVSVPPGQGARGSSVDFVEFSALVETAGDYRIRAGVRGPNGKENSFFIQVNNGKRWLWDIPRNNVLSSVYVSDRTAGELTFSLEQGVNLVRVSQRESGAQLDYIELQLTGSAPPPTEPEVDTIAPQLSIGSPAAAGEVQPSIVRFSGSAIEAGGSGLDRVFLSVQNAAGQWLDFNNGEFSSEVNSVDAQLGNLAAEKIDWTTQTPALSNGSYTVHATAVDKAGNASQVVTRGFEVDDTTPNASLYREAESGILAGDMEIITDPLASDGLSVGVLVGKGRGPYRNHYVDLSFTVDVPGNYRFLAGVKGPSGSKNSFYFQLNGGKAITWDIPKGNVNAQNYVSARRAGDLIELLNAGTHTVRVYLRESGAQLDYMQLQLHSSLGG